MWYLIWLLGVAFALSFSILVAIWGDCAHARHALDEKEKNHG